MIKRLKTLVIVNPISGTGKQKDIKFLLSRFLDQKRFEYVLVKTKFEGHASILAQEAIDAQYDAIIAVGGDGTVNEIAKILCNSTLALAILPCGSGNGLARHMGIPMSLKKAILWLNNANISAIDTIKVGNFTSINVSGFGFDALISHEFAKMSKRGLSSYIKAILKSFFAYEEETFFIETENERVNLKGMMLSIANSSQFGNNAYIAPHAELNDGLVNICILRKPKWFQIPQLIYYVFTKKIDRSSLYSELKCKEAKLNLNSLLAHIDGEPEHVNSTLIIRVKSKHLQLFTNKR